MIDNKFKRKAYNACFKEFVDANCITPDFPIPGVNFLDLFPILRKTNFKDITDIGTPDEPLIFVPEARGFLFFGALGADRCIPMRKHNKLPGELVSIDYNTEYSTDHLSFQKSAVLSRLKELNWDKSVPVPVCFFDDIVATGQSAQAIIDTINSMEIDGYTFKVTLACFYIELTALNGRSKITNTPVFSYYEY